MPVHSQRGAHPEQASPNDAQICASTLPFGQRGVTISCLWRCGVDPWEGPRRPAQARSPMQLLHMHLAPGCLSGRTDQRPATDFRAANRTGSEDAHHAMQSARYRIVMYKHFHIRARLLQLNTVRRCFSSVTFCQPTTDTDFGRYAPGSTSACTRRAHPAVGGLRGVARRPTCDLYGLCLADVLAWHQAARQTTRRAASLPRQPPQIAGASRWEGFCRWRTPNGRNTGSVRAADACNMLLVMCRYWQWGKTAGMQCCAASACAAATGCHSPSSQKMPAAQLTAPLRSLKR